MRVIKVVIEYQKERKDGDQRYFFHEYQLKLKDVLGVHFKRMQETALTSFTLI